VVLERPGALDEVYDRARAAYGDLHDPDHGFFSRALEVQPWRGLVEQLSEFVKVSDYSDREDGVCFRCSLEERRRWWRGRTTQCAAIQVSSSMVIGPVRWPCSRMRTSGSAKPWSPLLITV
jgi:hypothetical protein